MQFVIEQRFPCPPDRFFDLLEGEELEDRVKASSSSVREALGAHWDGPIFVRRTRIRPRRELPGLVAKLLGPEGLSYVQVVHTARQDQENRWHLEVDRVGERVRIAGLETARADGSGMRLRLDTTVEVDVPLVAGRVEAAVRREIERVFERRRIIVEAMVAGI
ncbi:MAG: DUF2505 family protein [Alphaproteobacteria bacterium]|nr:DUF2505 family protein [Alphaproteobacteria bacterium]